MADISKINGVPIANIEKLDAVLAANIAKVNGLVFSTAAAFLLDTYTGAAAGYSTRRLATSATVLMRVRRETAGGTGDDDEADVAYDSNNELSLDSAISNASAGVTATTLGQFLNVGTVNGTTYTNPDSLTVTASCFVDEWKDQSGNANHAQQSTQGNQPQIHSGTVNTDLILENGKPALEFNQDGFAPITGSKSDILFHTSTQGMLYNVGNYTASQNQLRIIAETNGTSSSKTGFVFGIDDRASTGNNDYGYYSLTKSAGAAGAIIASTEASFVGAQYLMAIHYDFASGIFQYQNGSLLDSRSSLKTYGTGDATNDLAIGNIAGNYNYSLVGKMQELILYNAHDANRTGIESNINSNYLIYQPTDAPTSGLLATYTGAAAAYSVRQLSDKAVIALRIRRDSDDEETNIGWDANGDLDTTAISDFCSTANGYVTRWWDQSTNGRHIDQQIGGASSLQPQIYNGTAVINDGTSSIPAIYFDGSNALESSSFTTVSQPLTVFHSLTLTQAFGTTKYIWSLQGFSGGVNNMADNGTKWKYWYGGSLDRNVGTSGIGQHLLTSLADGTDSTVWENGTMVVDGRQDSGSVGMDQIYLGGWNSTTNQFDGYINEWIIYPTDQDAAGNRSGIEQNIDNYFQIT